MPSYEEYLGMADRADKAGDAEAARDLMSLANEAKGGGEAAAKPALPAPSLEQRVTGKEWWQLDPNIKKRGTILPIGVNQEGKPEAALPQIAADMVKSFALPGHVIEGGTYTPEDAARFTMDYLAPAASRPLPATAKLAPPKAAAPTLESIKQQSTKLFKQADNMGLVVSKNSVKNLVDDVTVTLKEKGFHPKMQTDVATALKELEKASGRDLPLRELQTLREIALGAGGSLKPKERMLSGDIIEMIDDYLDNLSGQDVVAGSANAQEASAVLSQARNLWSRMRKGEVIKKIYDDAEVTAGQYSVSGNENAVRSGFRALAKNEKKMRSFSEAEREAIRKVAKGGPIGNLMRLAGKLAIRGPVSAAPSVGAGMYAGDPFIGGLVAGAGELGKLGATMATMRNARLADELIRRGAPAPSRAGALLTDHLANAATKGLMPIAGTQLPLMTQSEEDQRKLAARGYR